MSQTLNTALAVIGLDIGKNSFHIAGVDARGAIVLRQKWSRGLVEARLLPSSIVMQRKMSDARHCLIHININAPIA